MHFREWNAVGIADLLLISKSGLRALAYHKSGDA